jgi:hypothetical protein
VRRSLILLLIVTASACNALDLPVLDSQRGTPVPIDLSDTDQMALLGSPEPTGILWQRTVAGFTILGQTAAPDADELAIIKIALSNLPDSLPNQVRYFVRATDSRDLVSGDPFAATQGPDIYLFDASFSRELSPAFSLRRAIIHELVHVEQFASLDPLHVGNLLTGDEDQVRLSESLLIPAFAKTTGWEESNGSWVLIGPAANDYGATSPTEDMAESVAKAFAGEVDQLSDGHRRAVINWLGVSESDLSDGVPWVPAHAEEVAIEPDLFDTAAVLRMAGTRRYDIISFTLPASSDDAEAVAADVEAALRNNGFSGELLIANDAAILRYEGQFLLRDGTIVWTEIRDFREAPGFSNGPGVPVLIYVIVWG